MSDFTRRVIMIVPATDRVTANTKALSFDPGGGDKTFTAGLSPTGQPPATHYWCGIQMREAAFADLQARALLDFPTGIIAEWSLDTDRQKPDTLLTQLGLKRLIKPMPTRN